MHVKFNMDGSVVEGWLMMASHRQDISFSNETSDDGVEQYHTVTWDDTGFAKFIYKGREMYVHDMCKLSMAELASRVSSNTETDDESESRQISSTDLATGILSDGFENVRFLIPLRIPSVAKVGNKVSVKAGEIVECVCKLKRGFNVEPHECYRLCFEVESDKSLEGLITCTDVEFDYKPKMSDVLDGIKSGRVKILESVDDGKTPEQHIDEYFAKYRVYSDAYVKMLAAE